MILLPYPPLQFVQTAATRASINESLPFRVRPAKRLVSLKCLTNFSIPDSEMGPFFFFSPFAVQNFLGVTVIAPSFL